MVKITSWGRLSHLEHQRVLLSDCQQVAKQLQQHQPGIAHGMGRSYGDVCLNPNGVLWQTTSLNRFIHFDDNTGCLTCEAGILLGDIQALFMPRGWSLAVTPGTQFVTVGGAIANDIHGKNHHVMGSFGDHVKHLHLVRTDGSLIECSPTLLPNWFAATVGGLGLTGIITQVSLQLQPVPGPWLDTETVPFTQLSEFFALADSSESTWQHTVSWIDCLSTKGRGLFMRANPCDIGPNLEPQCHAHTMRFTPPLSLVNGLTLKPLNSLYYQLKKWRAGRSIAHYQAFFYPLDNLLHWNRLYGPKGFYQYQSVVPREVSLDAVAAMLAAIKQSGQGSFLAVLKTFGDREALGMLSFPQPGVTLALDFPNRGDKTLSLFKRLDAIVREAGGRIYMAKDARMPRELFELGYPCLNEFLTYRDSGISSSLSRRLMDY